MDKEILIDDILKEKAFSEKLSLPGDLDALIKNTIKNLPNRKRKKGSIGKRATIAATIVLVAGISLSAAFPAYARNLPVVSSVFQFLSDSNLIDKDYVEYSSDLNLSKTSNGVTVTINSIAYDGIDLSIAYTVESKEEMKDDPHIADKVFKINGKSTTFGSGGIGKFVNSRTYIGVDSFHVANDYLPKEIKKAQAGGSIKIPDNFIMDLNINKLSNGMEGNWDFKFRVSKDKIQGKVTQVKTNMDLSKIRPTLRVTEVIFTPINTVIRTVENTVETSNFNYFIVIDDKGRRLSSKGGSGSGSADINKMYWEDTYRNIYEDTKAVTFIPVTLKEEFKQKQKNSNGNFTFDIKEVPLNLTGTTTLSQGKIGEYKITQVELLSDKTIIHYECTNLIASAFQYNFTIKDDEGKEFALNKENVKDEDGKFVAEIKPLSKDKRYTLSSVDYEKKYEIREDLKFTIDVK